MCLPVPKKDSVRNLPTLSWEAMPPRACCLCLYIWIRGVNNWKSNRHMCKDSYVGNLSSSPGEEYFWSNGQPQATMSPSDSPWVLAVPQLDSRQTHSAFLVNFVIIGENICQHTLTEHKCSI